MIPSTLGLARLAQMAFEGRDMTPTWQRLTAAFKMSDCPCPDHQGKMCAALMDMCLVDQMRGSAERGLGFQAQALADCRLYQVAPGKSPSRITLLGFVIAGRINANTPAEFLVENTDVTLILMYIVPGLPLPPVPEHDVAFVMVSEAEEARPVLRELERILTDWPRPVLNRPERVARTGRECLYRTVSPIPGVAMPATVRVDWAKWEDVARGETHVETLLPDGGFPVIIRPLDSHAGDGLEKIGNVAEAASYLARHEEAEFHLSRFVDYRSPDGLYRKYRIVVIDGQPFPCHMAASDHWMIHYLNAGMLDSDTKRADEAHFMDCFQEDFGRRHGPALAAMTEALGLEYYGIDCGETPDGRLLVFEAGTALVVHDMDDPEIFPYKRPHMHRIFEAFHDLLDRRGSFI